MGGTIWSDDFYKDREAARAKTGKSAFAYHDVVVKAKPGERKVHAQMNPLKITRESRDSKEHPESLAIAVMFDVTGSMASVPITLQKKLPQLMGLLIDKKYVAHPQVLFGAVGDARSDKGSLQVGQFESGIEMDDDLGRMWLEGNGGGSCEESYQNALYFFGNHTSIDCQEKRNKKGYLFLIGDERPYMQVTRGQVEAIMGDSLQEDIPIADVIAKAREKYNVFFIIPQNTSHGRDPSIRATWVNLLGEDSVLSIEDENGICELIGLTIGICEGTANLDEARQDLVTGGTEAHLVNTVAASLHKLAGSRGQAGASKAVRV